MPSELPEPVKRNVTNSVSGPMGSIRLLWERLYPRREFSLDSLYVMLVEDFGVASYDDAGNLPPATIAAMLRERAGGQEEEQPQNQPDLLIDLARMTVTLNGTEYDVTSERALRWLQVLAGRPGEWLTSADVAKHDALVDCRTDHLKRYLPPEILSLIESRPGAGSRLHR